jgi:hypothetical protein
MPEKPEQAVEFKGETQYFPSDWTEAQISSALGAIPESNKDAVPNAPTWKALTMMSAGRAVPMMANASMEFATNPSVPRTAATIGRVVGAVAPTVGEAATGNVPAAIALAANAGKTAWTGGKAGWFTGKLAQNAAAPVASMLEKAAPYAQTLSTLGGAAGVGELAQVSEPNRKDIGFLGIGPTDQKLSDQIAVQKMQVQNLVNSGLSLNDAIRRVSEAWRPR